MGYHGNTTWARDTTIDSAGTVIKLSPDNLVCTRASQQAVRAILHGGSSLDAESSVLFQLKTSGLGHWVWDFWIADQSGVLGLLGDDRLLLWSYNL